MKYFRISVLHHGCFTEQEEQYSGLDTIIDMVMDYPKQGDENVIYQSGYMVLFGKNEDDKEKFFNYCSQFNSPRITFTKTQILTKFDYQPTVFYYRTVQVLKPCVITILTNSKLKYKMPILISIKDGREILYVEGSDEDVNEFVEDFDAEGIGEIQVEETDEKIYRKEIESMKMARRIVRGMHTYYIMKTAVDNYILQHRHGDFLREVFLNPDKSLKDILAGYQISYTTGRQEAADMKQRMYDEMKHIFRIIDSDIEEDRVK